MTMQVSPKGQYGAAVASTLIVLGALGLAGCAQEVSAGPGTNPTSTSSETPGGNNGETVALTYQEEIQKGIEARPKEGVAIKVADYPSLEVAAKAWTDEYIKCLFSGNIKMTEDNKAEYFAFTPGSIAEKVPNDFKLADNFETCVSNLVADNDFGQNLINAGVELNADIVIQQFADTKLEIINRDFSVSDVTDSSIKARLNFTITLDGENPSDTIVGGKLENINGNLISTDRLV